MKTSLPFIVSALSLLAVSCNDKELPTPSPVQTQIQEESSSAVISNLKSPAVIAAGESYKLDGKNRIVEFKTADQLHKFSYNPEGKLVKCESFKNGDAKLESTVTYSNLGNQSIFDGQRLFKIASGVISSVSIPSLNIEHKLAYDAKGNISILRTYKNGSLISKVNYTTTNLTEFSVLTGKNPFLFMYKFL